MINNLCKSCGSDNEGCECISETEIESRAKEFTKATGHSPKEFLRLYRQGEIPDTLNNTLSFWSAQFLAGSEPNKKQSSDI